MTIKSPPTIIPFLLVSSTNYTMLLRCKFFTTFLSSSKNKVFFFLFNFFFLSRICFRLWYRRTSLWSVLMAKNGIKYISFDLELSDIRRHKLYGNFIGWKLSVNTIERFFLLQTSSQLMSKAEAMVTSTIERRVTAINCRVWC